MTCENGFGCNYVVETMPFPVNSDCFLAIFRNGTQFEKQIGVQRNLKNNKNYNYDSQTAPSRPQIIRFCS